MKTNRIILILITLLFSSPMFSQEYIPLPEEDGFWKVEHYGPDCFDEEPYGGLCYVSQTYLEGDTIINDISYNKVYENGMSYNSYPNPTSYWGPYYRGCYRNDIANKKVFFIRSWDPQNEEVLLYDFNLQIGDTIQTYLTTDIGSQEPKVVESIDSVLVSFVNNTYAKRYKLSDYMLDLYLVEGIGSMGGLVDQILEGFEYDNRVICFQNDSDGLNWNVGGNSSCDIISSVYEPKLTNTNLSLSPNPARNHIEVLLNDAMNSSNSRINIYQINGLLVQSISMRSTCVILNIEDYNSGVYIIEIESDGIVQAREKMIVQ